mgnify:CR=1 FL=1
MISPPRTHVTVKLLVVEISLVVEPAALTQVVALVEKNLVVGGCKKFYHMWYGGSWGCVMDVKQIIEMGVEVERAHDQLQQALYHLNAELLLLREEIAGGWRLRTHATELDQRAADFSMAAYMAMPISGRDGKSSEEILWNNYFGFLRARDD